MIGSLLIAFLLLILPVSSWATAISSATSGNWSATGTWTGGVVPGAGDTASILTTHQVVVDTNTTIGTSGVAGTAAILVTGSGSLIVSSGATLTARGDVNLANATLTMDAGSALTFDDNSSAAIYILHIGTANSQSSKLLCNGTSGSRVAISSKNGGTNGRISDGGFINGGYVDCTYTTFTRIGDATHNSFETWVGTGKVFRLNTSVILDACGPIKTTVAPSATAIFTLNGVTIKNSVGTKSIDTSFGGTPSGGGAWTITNNVFDKNALIQPPTNVTITGNLFLDRPFLTGTGAPLVPIEGNLLYKTIATDTNIFSDFFNNYVLIASVADNPHGIDIAGAPRNVNIFGNIVEILGTNANGDMFTTGNPVAPQTYTWKYNIILPAAGAPSTVSSGDVVSLLQGPNITVVAEHNTYNVGAQGESGFHTGETYLGRADFITSVQNNLAWSNSGAGYIVVVENPGTYVANSMTTVDYNGRNTMTGSYNVPAGAIRNTAGVHDVVGDPGFIDSARNIAKWDLSLGGPGTAANALTELGKRNDASGYNPAYTIAALMTYVKAGFQPTNQAFHAANDSVIPTNGWMGAIEGTPPPPPPTATVPIPQFALWQTNMTSYGASSCATLITDLAGGNANLYLADAYYDAIAVYLQIKQYTSNAATWDPCIAASRTAFRDNYVLAQPTPGAVSGIENFTRGLRLDWELNADATSKTALIDISHQSAYGRDIQNMSNIISPAYSRETAYVIRSYVNSELVGDGRRIHLLQYVDLALGHIDQWFISKSYRCNEAFCSNVNGVDATGLYYVQPFMAGLTMEALIAYYDIETDVTKKANILANVRVVADWLWAHAWVPTDQAFWYQNYAPTADTLPTPTADTASGSAPDLNLLIVPAWGWLYHVTGETKYRDQGDQIFAGGVLNGDLGNGKRFNQQYQTSFDYVTWRSQAVTGFQEQSRLRQDRTPITQPRALRR